MEGFFLALSSASNTLKVGGIFIAVSVGLALNSIIYIIFCLQKSHGKRLKIVHYSLVCFLFSFGLAMLFSLKVDSATERVVAIFCLISAYALINLLQCLIEIGCRGKSKKSETKYKDGYEFVRSLEQEKTDDGDIKVESSNVIFNLTTKRKNNDATSKALADVNFSHVKNIIERMGCYDLSAQDRRQIKELEMTINHAERTGSVQDEKIKNYLNDGLNGLLKIMARYGI